MSLESRENNVLGNFHKPISDSHPADSLGNQQIWGPGGHQVGAIEYIFNPKTGKLEAVIKNKHGDNVKLP